VAGETVYTSEEETTEDDSAAEEEDEDDATADDEDSAAALAARGAVDVADDSEFLPLGVFALAPAGQNLASAVVQLAVNHDGILRGSYCDLLTDQGQTVYGAVDKASNSAAWTVGPQGRVVFATTLENLTRASGPLAVTLPGGDTRQYTLARFQNQTADAQ
jgi:hypothetical protein